MYARFAQFAVALAVFGCLVFASPAKAAEEGKGAGEHAPAAAPGEAGHVGEATSDHPEGDVDAGEDTAHHAGGHDDHAKFEKPPIYLSPQLLIFTLVLFGLYFFTMKSSAWQPLIAGLNEREARVLRAEREAAQAKAEAARFHEQAEKRMVDAHNQVKEILAKARAEAEAQKIQIVADAEREATRVKEEALDEISAARQQAINELSRMVDSQAAMASSRIAGRSFN